MHSNLKRVLRDLIPPALLRLARALGDRYGYSGAYSSWQEADGAAQGYDSDLILSKVRDALLKVKRGEAVYERDSVLFDEVQYSWPLLAGLLWIASRNGNRLSLIDFGGSLGSSYFQNRAFLDHLGTLRWCVIEQKSFVECGKNDFQSEELRFFFTIGECLAQEQPDTMLLCSVLPYLEDPYALLGEIVGHGFPYLLVDRTPFLPGDRDRLTVQQVPPEIYPASYPAWFLGEEKFRAFLDHHYEMVAQFDSLGGEISLDGATAFEKGFIFKKRQ